jgi:hypothetical protein
MNEGDTLLNKDCRDFYNNLAWVLLDLNDRQFWISYRLWQQQRKAKNSPLTRAMSLLKKIVR